jgi:hypothetical protein
MSAYKRLNKQDAYITTYTAHKPWTVLSSSFDIYGIEVFTGDSSYLSSIKQLYYPSKSEGNVSSHSYDYYPQTTLEFPESREYSLNSTIISIPRNLYGVSIQPGVGFKLEVGSTNYVAEGYWEGGYVEEASAYTIEDDGEGNLILSGSLPKQYVGDIIYSHGIIVITDAAISTETIESLSFKSSHPIFTHNYHCKLRESEFNFTYNPSSTNRIVKTTYDNEGMVYSTASIESGVIADNITGSEFQPYITTIGLYNDANELIAVAKTGQPIIKAVNTEMVITVKIDI